MTAPDAHILPFGMHFIPRAPSPVVDCTRAINPNQPTIAPHLSPIPTRRRPAGSLYYYFVIAKNAFGDSLPSVERNATRGGVPVGWRDADIGSPPLPGQADYSDAGDSKFEIEAGGTGIGIPGFLNLSSTDKFHFTHRTMTGDGTITARATRPLTSRLSAFGVMMRETTANNAKHASMMITPSSNPQAWSAT